MPAREKVSAQQIVNALLKWTGNIQAAADELGVSRNALYARITKARLDIAAIRAMKVGTGDTTVTGMPSMWTPVEHVRKSSTAIFSLEGRSPRLGSMRTAAEEDAPVEIPIRTTEKKLPATRITSAHRELLRRATWSIQARFQAPTDEQTILEQFIDEAFGPWLATKLAATKAKAKDGGK